MFFAYYERTTNAQFISFASIETYLYGFGAALNMKKIMSWLIQKDRKLFDMLAGQSANILEEAKELGEFIHEYSKFERNERKAKASSIKKMEDKAGKLKFDITNKLRRSSAADRIEMGNIAVALNEIADLISNTALKFVILGIERVDDHIPKLADALQNSAECLNKITLNLKKPSEIKIHYERLQSLKLEAEGIYNEALSELFHFYKNSIDIMKYREIYDILGAAIKKCGDAAGMIEEMFGKR